MNRTGGLQDQYAPDSMRPIYQSEDLNATFNALATSMSNSIRSNADNGTSVIGTVGVLQVLNPSGHDRDTRIVPSPDTEYARATAFPVFISKDFTHLQCINSPWHLLSTTTSSSNPWMLVTVYCFHLVNTPQPNRRPPNFRIIS